MRIRKRRQRLAVLKDRHDRRVGVERAVVALAVEDRRNQAGVGHRHRPRGPPDRLTRLLGSYEWGALPIGRIIDSLDSVAAQAHRRAVGHGLPARPRRAAQFHAAPAGPRGAIAGTRSRRFPVLRFLALPQRRSMP